MADLVPGQPDFVTTTSGSGRDRMRNPTAVATDWYKLAVANTDNNRVLIWNSIPLNFGCGRQVNEHGRSGPQGVWIDHEGGLWVADTLNNRILS